MRIFFLGTGAAEGIPALFCGCALCREAGRRGGRDLRMRTSALAGGLVRIDLPPDTLAQTHRYPEQPLAEIEHLLFTHSHDDHFAPRELQYLSPNFAPQRTKPLQIWLTEECRDRICAESRRFFEKAPLKMRIVEPERTYRVGPLWVTPFAANHSPSERCLNFLLADVMGGEEFLYGSDTGWYTGTTWDFLATRRLRGAVMECGKGISENPYAGHLSLSECAAVKTRLHQSGSLPANAPFFLTHFSHTGLLLHDALTERAAPLGMTVAHDGLEVEV
ncbi:MAG: hypothetical protein H7Z41_00360 [Cytophagales bacterium]|nr:hypothetical protein [Armatimonadota bacterium]